MQSRPESVPHWSSVATGRVKVLIDECEPQTYLIADLSRENDKQYLSHPIRDVLTVLLKYINLLSITF